MRGFQNSPVEKFQEQNNVSNILNTIGVLREVLQLTKFLGAYKETQTLQHTAQKNRVKSNGLLAFTTKPQVELDTRYHQSRSITQTLQNYRHRCAESPPARNSILRWAQNFENYSRAGNAQDPVRWAKKLGQAQRVCSSFILYASCYLVIAEQDLRIAWSSIYHILRTGLHMIRYWRHSAQKIEHHNYNAHDDIANCNCSL